ncbi:MAG TPA: hypothetical protein VGD47_00315 [Steroidobacteraceae bacterium]
MLLQCETEDGAADEGTDLAGWLRPGTLESLVELNELCLGLLAEQAAARTTQVSPLLRQVEELLLDAAARRRAAACPYLLLDAGFADPLRWRRPAALGVGDTGHAAYTTFFTVPGATEVARLVFTYAWHLARSQSAAARLLLGMPAPCAALIGHHSLRQIHALAETHPEWLKPRWPARVQVWRELLLAAAAGEAAALERARLHGLTLLAAEVRGALPERPV